MFALSLVGKPFLDNLPQRPLHIIYRQSLTAFYHPDIIPADPMKEATEIAYQTLKAQYEHWGVPTHLIDETVEFTIFNLKDLHQPLPFKSPISRVNFFTFVFIKNGHGHYVVDDQTFTMEPNTLYFTNPGHYRSFHYTQIDEVYLITLSESFLRENVHPDIFEEFPFLLTETFPARTVEPAMFAEFEGLYLQIHKEYTSRSPFRNRLIGSLFVVLLLKHKEHLWLDYNALYEGSRSSEIVKNFKRRLEQHYRDLAAGLVDHVFRVQEYADAQSLHPNYISSVIKSKTGKPIGTWIAEKSISEAKVLLQNSSLSVKEIAYRLGFAEAAHFSNYFKKHTDQSPGLYRRQRSPTAE